MRSFFAVLLFVGACSSTPSTSRSPTSVLIFSRTLEFRHDSIADGVACITSIGEQEGWNVVRGEDPAMFTDATLSTFDVVVWLSTTGDVLDADQQSAFERYVESGGGFVAVHSASDTEYDWSWYGALVGAYFESHPAIQLADIHVEDPTHPATLHLPAIWSRTDEWYNFQENPRARVHVLLSLDESTYDGGTMGDHPIAWTQTVGEGRSFYTALGHTTESYSEENFRMHLRGAITWAAD